jgi:hypothetical protein
VQAAFVDHHFDQDLNFLATEEDPVTKKVSFENFDVCFLGCYLFDYNSNILFFSFIDGEKAATKCQAKGYFCSYFKLSGGGCKVAC